MDHSEDKKELKDLLMEREKHITKMFWFLVEIGLIFLVPATIVLIVSYFTEYKIEFYLLPTVFVLSWLLFYYRFKKINKKMKEIDSKIKSVKGD